MSSLGAECSYRAREEEFDGDDVWEQFKVFRFSKFEEAVKLLQKTTSLYTAEREWKKAAKAYRTLASCHLRLDRTYDAAAAYRNTAACHEMIGNLRKTEKYLEKAAHLYLECDDYLTTAEIYQKLSNHCARTNNVVKALEYCHKAALLFLNDSRYFEVGIECLQHAAYFAYQTKDCSQAVELYKLAAISYFCVLNFRQAGACTLSVAQILEETQDEDTTTLQEYYGIAAVIMLRSNDLLTGYQLKLKVACLAVQSTQYSRAIELFESVAKLYVGTRHCKFRARQCLLYALLCTLCMEDLHIDSIALLTVYELGIYPDLESTKEWHTFKELAKIVVECRVDMPRLSEVIRNLGAEEGIRGYKMEGIKGLLLSRILEKVCEKQRLAGMTPCKFSDVWGIDYDRDDGCAKRDLISRLNRSGQTSNVLHLRSGRKQLQQEANESSAAESRTDVEDEDPNHTISSLLSLLVESVVDDVEATRKKRKEF